MSFRDAVEMKMNNLSIILEQINSFIDELNNIDYQISRKKRFIQKLEFTYNKEDDYLDTKISTEISYLNL